MMIRTVFAVLAGWALVGVFVVLTDGVIHAMAPQEYVAGRIPPDWLAAISLATATLYSVAGGWLTARIASRKKWAHVVYLVMWGELMGLASAVMTWGKIQNWYQVGLLIAWIPAVLLGGYLHIGRSPAESRASAVQTA
jgi:hypothetical protein